jgi:hypothetical protein
MCIVYVGSNPESQSEGSSTGFHPIVAMQVIEDGKDTEFELEDCPSYAFQFVFFNEEEEEDTEK